MPDECFRLLNYESADWCPCKFLAFLMYERMTVLRACQSYSVIRVQFVLPVRPLQFASESGQQSVVYDELGQVSVGACRQSS